MNFPSQNKTREKILLLADSQALPRAGHKRGVAYEHTFPWVLREILQEETPAPAPVLIERANRFKTIVDVLKEWHEEVELKKPGIVIICIGGCDSPPRILRPAQRTLLAHFPIPVLGRLLVNLELRVRPYLLPFFRNRTYVHIERFGHCLDEVIYKSKEAGLTRLIFVNIVRISDKVELINPGAIRNAQRFNEAIAKRASDDLVSVVDLHQMIMSNGGPDQLTVDGIHLAPQAHQLLARQLADIVVPLLHSGSAAKTGAKGIRR
jgi:lysophospholipase L1-like esterase